MIVQKKPTPVILVYELWKRKSWQSLSKLCSPSLIGVRSAGAWVCKMKDIKHLTPEMIGYVSDTHKSISISRRSARPLGLSPVVCHNVAGSLTLSEHWRRRQIPSHCSQLFCATFLFLCSLVMPVSIKRQLYIKWGGPHKRMLKFLFFWYLPDFASFEPFLLPQSRKWVLLPLLPGSHFA